MIILWAEWYVRQAHNLKVVGSNPTPATNYFMLNKYEIIIVIITLLLIFYFVISLGAGKKKDKSRSPEIKRYLLGVRTLIIIIGVVSLVLWFFL